MTPPRIRTATRARIEIIPLIDVVFFLLATFVLFTLSLNKIGSIPLTFPVTPPILVPPAFPPVVISVSAGDALAWDGVPIAAQELTSRLAFLREDSPAPRVMVAGDVHASYGAAIRIIDAARTAGISQVSVETRVRPVGR